MPDSLFQRTASTLTTTMSLKTKILVLTAPFKDTNQNHKTEQLSPALVAVKEMADEDKADRDRVFKRFDANGDGKISASELGDALKTLGSVTVEEVTRMMAEIDTDGDGFISYEEFTDFATANRGLMKDVAKIF